MAADDDLLREMAQHRGFKLVKSRRRKPGVGDFGKFGLADAKTGKQCFGFGGQGLTASAEEIESYLRSGAISTWKQSVGSVNAKPTKAPAKALGPAPEDAPRSSPAKPDPPLAAKVAVAKPTRPKPAPAPKPEPKPEPELHIRKARRNDAEALAQLMAQAGGEANGKLVAARIAVLARSNGSVVVADRGGVVGCAAWHLLVMLQGPPIGRLTLLVVERKSRRQGIGKALLESVAAEMKAKGCDSFEAVAEIDFSGTQNFFRRLGFDRKSYRFSRSI